MPTDSKSRSAPIIFAVAVIALIAGGYLWSRKSGDAAPAPEPAAMPAAQTKIDPDGPGVAAAPAPVAAAAGGDDYSTERKRVSAHLDSEMQKIAANHASQRTDAAWAATKAQSLTAKASTQDMKQLGAIVRDFRVDCRTTLCKVSGSFASGTAADDWTTLYTLNVGEGLRRTTFTTRRQPDGTSVVELYGEGR